MAMSGGFRSSSLKLRLGSLESKSCQYCRPRFAFLARLKNAGRMRRTLDVGCSVMQSRSAKKKGRLRRKVYSKMTWAAFKEFHSRPENGNMADHAILSAWAELEKGDPVDFKGTVGGVSGCKRYRVKLRSESYSDSATEEERAVVKGSKPNAKTIKIKDAEDFIKGIQLSCARCDAAASCVELRESYEA